ncbi:PQQ-dependent sugar dehydrogenase [Psychrosphaera aestuarii]|uniref:PQQ-dependent sugar dehydrogenase n=1 Tax=Psychrosphaera aestuarii TaxID=1266052 RepID=UPI001B33A83F|nr:PQQ-dependent sugar dehydrogenase [Psychrosphaera aestuarii]
MKPFVTILLGLLMWQNYAVANNQLLSSSLSPVDVKLNTTTLYEGLHKPWGIAHLSSELFLITERNGEVRLWNNATGIMSKANSQFTDSVYESGQGGMLDVIAHPDYADNQWVYFTFASGHKFSNGTTLARAKLNINTQPKATNFTFENIEILFRATPQKAATYHFAGRMAFLPDTTLVFGVGDGYSYMDDAQKLDSHLGKILRLKDNGEVPSDNPYIKTDGALPEIYSIGHRNPQGLFYDKHRKLLFSNEHGPKGGDEINIIKPKLNYGWPKITYGIDYSGLEITPHNTMQGLESPLVNWTPSIAPGSLLIYSGEEFPEFKNTLITTALKYQEMRVVKLAEKNESTPESQVSISHSGLELSSEQTYLKNLKERLRDVVEDEQGRLLIVTDSGKLIRLSKQ